MRARYWNNTLLFERACIEGTRLKWDIRRNAKRNGQREKEEGEDKKKGQPRMRICRAKLSNRRDARLLKLHAEITER